MLNTPNIRFKGFTEPWEQRKLGEVAGRIYGGGTPKTGVEKYWDGNIPWIQSSNLSEHELFHVDIQKYITKLGLQKSAAQLVPKNSIAVVSHVGVGKLVFMPFDYTTSQDFISLSQLSSNLIFTCYAIYKRLQEDLHIVQGSAIKGITKGDLLNKEIMFPSLPEQEKLGNAMQNLDHFITLHQRKWDEMSKLKKFMLQKMFPKNGEQFPEIRFNGFTEPWEQRKLGELIEKYEDPVETPHVGYERIGIRSHAKGTFHSYVEAGKELDTAKMHRVAADKFILNITFAWEHAVAITDESDVGKLVSHRFPQFSFGADLKPLFFKYVILDKKFREHLELSSPGGAGRNRILKIDDMFKYDVKFPSINEQMKIGQYFDGLDHLITLHQRKCDEFKEIKKYMLQNMFPQKG